MIEFTAAQIAEVVQGELAADPTIVIADVVIDSREAKAHDLFVGVVGENHDGHDHAGDAHRRGASLTLASAPVDVPHVLVQDTVVALGLLARALLDRLPELTVVAMTGSSGKTSTKDLVAQVLERSGAVIAPPGSFNNEIGLPMTVLRADASTRYLVLEMGARGIGHIAYLCEIAPPHMAAVLNVGSAHVGEFGGRDNIALAKGEIVEALQSHGVAVLNADDEYVRVMVDRTSARAITFGLDQTADVRIHDLELDSMARPTFWLSHQGSRAQVSLELHGEHHAHNAAAAASFAIAAGMELESIAQALSAATSRSRWRMEVSQAPSGITVINDAYNANPESMQAALKALVASAAGRRTWAVLGEMKELGEDSTSEHDRIGRMAVRLNVSNLIVVGEGARAIHLGASHEGSWGQESRWVPDVEGALAILRAELQPDDVVLVKASRAIGLERVAEALLDPASSISGSPQSQEAVE